MHRLFIEVDALVLEMNPINPESKRYLQRFGAMHIGAILSERATSTASNPPNVENLKDLIDDKGIPADCAFTICNFVDAIHFFVGVSKSYIKSVRFLVFKNYAYGLQRVKRFAFFANVFACLHYDTFRTESEDILQFGEYPCSTFNDSKQKNMPEVRIYVAFIRLILADLRKQLGYEKTSLEYIKKASIFRDVAVHSPSLIGLCDFLKLFSEMINDEKAKVKPEQLEQSFLMLPECKEKYNKAICASRHYKFSSNSRLVKLWLKRLDPKNTFVTTIRLHE